MNHCSLLNRKINLIFFIAFIILMALAIAGCAAPKVKMYPGDKVEDNKQAVIRGEERAKGKGKITITRVDGERTLDFFTHLSSWGAGEVYVLSGKHELVARIDNGFTYAFGYLWLVAESGETYTIKARTEGYKTIMWLENERSGQMVGGIIGCDDEPK